MDHLQTEARNPASTHLDELTPLEFVRLMNTEDQRVIEAVASQAEAIAQAIEVIAERLRVGGRLVYVGAGTSGRLGVLDATECPPTFSSPVGQVVGVIAGGPPALTQAVEGAEDHPEFAERDLAAIDLTNRDVLVGIATSGRTPYVLGAVACARKQGAFTIGLACSSPSELEPLVDLAIIPVVGPEILSGSTRLKAGTATKLVLNALSTGAMVRLGKTFGNLMVDLRATNFKLKARTKRIVSMLTGLAVEEAEKLLQHCAGELKTALIVHQARTAPEEARRLLEAAGGQVRKVLEAISPTHTAALSPVAANLILGIDGGGTHTVALLAQSDPAEAKGWRILGRGEAGPSNLHSAGSVRAIQALDQAVTNAFAAAQRPRVPVAVACLGMAGADRPDDRQILADWAGRIHLAENLHLTSDAAILLAAGTPANWGLAIVAGTGSIAFGRTADGKTARAGGWGYLLGDEGSGYALVMAALQAIVQAADRRGPATTLTNRLLSRMELERPEQLVAAVYRGHWDRPALSSLAPLVLEDAVAGDAVAGQIVAEATTQLAQTAQAVAQCLALEKQAVPVALAGGLLLASTTYRQKLLEKLTTLGLQVDPVELVPEPAQGALRLALSSISKT